MKSETIIAELDDVIEKLKMRITYLESEVKNLNQKISSIKNTIKKV